MKERTVTNPDLNAVPSLANRAFSRRGFLAAGGAVVGGAALAACSSNSSSPTTTAAPNKPANPAAPTGDAAVATLAAGLEVLAVSTYKSALAAATSNKLGPVPPAVATYVQTAITDHQAHLDTWNAVLTSAGGQPVTKPNATLAPQVTQQFGQVTDVTGAAKLALSLEQIAAATYQSAIPTLKSKDAITAASNMFIIDMQHSAILYFVMGQYPVPDVFAKTDKAISK